MSALGDEKTVSHRGCALAYRVRGPAGAPAVLFVHGTATPGDAWAPQIDALAARWRCVSFDNRGMAASQPLGEARITVAQMAEDAAAVLDAERIEAAHVVGHSLGGPIALELALSRRARVRSLALLCSFARGKDATKMTPKMFWLGLRTRLGPRASRRRAFLELIVPPARLAAADAAARDALAAELGAVFGRDLADSPPVTMKQFAAMRAYDASARLGELAGLPTLVVSADHDPIAKPAYGRALAAGIPGARYVELAGASHAVVIHDAARVNALLEEHLSAVPAGT